MGIRCWFWWSVLWTATVSCRAVSGQAIREDWSNEGVPQGASSLAFVFDTTGSMWDDLRQVIDGAEQILATTLARREKVVFNYVLVPFHDPDIGPVTVTTDSDEFQARLQDLHVHGGGDCPEMSVSAIKLALDVSLPNSFIYVFTDAWAKDYALLEEVLLLVQKKGSQVLTFVKASLQAHKVNLLAVDRSQDFDEDIEFTVDQNLIEFTISIAGNNSDVFLTNPEGERASDVEDFTVLLSLSNVQIMNVKRPSPGLWKLRVASEGPHTVRSTGLSQLDFVHGFSNGSVLRIEDTKHRPVKGVPTTLLVKGVRSREAGVFQIVDLLDLKGNTVNVLPLYLLTPGPDPVYSTPPFIPPDDYFYLRVSGKDPEGNDFQRITSTALNAELPDIPEVHMPSLVTAYNSENVTLRCSIRSVVPYSVRWFMNTLPITSEERHRTNQVVELDIPSVSLRSRGMYSCNATNVAGVTVSTSYLDVKVEQPPVLGPSTNASITVGQKVWLHCRASAPSQSLTFSWKRLDEEGEGRHRISSPLRPDSTTLHNGTLILDNVQSSDQGWYRCTASSRGGTAQNDVFLSVFAPPRVHVRPQEITFQRGVAVEMRCEVTGHPRPSMHWHWHERQRLDIQMGRIKVQGPWMLIEDAKREDEGQYTCSATNMLGTDSQITTLRYIEKPVVRISVRRYRVRPGETVVLRCPASGTPTPEVHWMRGSEEVIPLSYVQVTSDGSLRILSVQELDAGEYSCLVRNSAGQDSGRMMLEVGVPASIVQLPESVPVQVGSSVSIPCVAAGTPPLQVIWRKEPQGTVQQADGALLIQDAMPEHKGVYVCAAANNYGQEEKTMTLTVTGIVAPSLSPMPSPAVTSLINGGALLPCPVTQGNPPPRIRWYQQGRLIDPEDPSLVQHPNGSLEIKGAREQHQGQYTCLADNAGGNASQVLNFTVYVPPVLTDSTSKSFSSVEGLPQVLSCEAVGVPPPTVTWSKDGSPLVPGPRHRTQSKGRLRIDPTKEEDSGTYTCTVTNLAGGAQKHFTLLVQVPPKITSDQGHENHVTQGSSVNLHCGVHAVPAPVIHWTKDGLSLDSDPRFQILNSGNLRVDAASPSDAGEYICEATNPIGKITRKVGLAVFVPPRILEVPSTEISPLLGSSVQLVCPVSGNPPPVRTWQRTNGELPDSHLTTPEGSLVLTDLKLSDSDLYWCVAENVAGTDSKNYTLVVIEPPQIIPNGENTLSVTKGKDLEVQCMARGYPEPQVHWKKDGNLIKGTELGLSVDEDGTLSVTDATLGHSGLYTCQASNAAGNDTKDYTLRVLVAPVLEPGRHHRHLSVLEGETATLTCPVFAEPRPDVTWFLDGRLLDVADDSRRQLEERGEVLHVMDTSMDDSGSYSCKAVNEVGETFVDFVLDIQVPPRFQDFVQSRSISVDVIENEPLKLTCKVQGNPVPKVVWFKDSRQVSVGEELLVRKVLSSDSGDYTCLATNQAGTTRQAFEVSVLVPPKVDITGVDSSEVVHGSPVSFHCLVSGHPAPVVIWKRQGQVITADDHPDIVISSDGRKLTLTKTEVKDGGEYVCVAENQAGNVEKTFQLHVLIPPSIADQDEVTVLKVLNGQNVSLECDAGGEPAPSVTWLKNGIQVPYATHSVLKVKESSVKDEGRYTCVARNKVGATEKEFQLHVLVPPQELPRHLLPEGSSVQDVLAGSEVTLTCPLHGHPTPSLSWWKNGVQLVNGSQLQILNGGRQLRIAQSRETDSGQYVCLAKNEAGQTKFQAPLNVLVPASIDRPEEWDTQPQVREGGKLLLECPIKGNPRPEIVWLRNGQAISTDDAYHTLDGSNLIVHQIKSSQSGKYTCVATNVVGTQEKSYDVDVIVAPTPDLYSAGDPQTSVLLYRSLVLRCPMRGHPPPQIRWLRNGSPVTASEGVVISQAGQQLTVLKATREDAGRYTCEAENQAGTSSLVFQVDVIVPPQLAPERLVKEVKTHEGQTVDLTCPAEGHPSPHITWLKDGNMLTNQSRVQILDSGTKLRLSNTTLDQSGQYSCVAGNEGGTVEHHLQLQIRIPPKLKEEKPASEQKAVVNRPVKLTCSVIAYPLPALRWLKDDLPLPLDPNLSISADGRQLTIRMARVSDAGLYKCIAVNEVGEAHKEINLKVQVGPSIVQSNRTAEGAFNTTATLVCQANGQPEPSIVWLRDGHVMTPEDRVDFRERGTQLVIQELRPEDAGVYTCVASNTVGSVEKHVELHVLVPPAIREDDDGPVVVLINRPLVLECILVAGDPAPVVSWTKDGIPLDLEQSRGVHLLDEGQFLKVLQTDREHEGQYSCLAENTAGSAEKKFLVDVYEPPVIKSSNPRPEALVGQPLHLECVSGGDPAPHITWFKRGLLLQQQDLEEKGIELHKRKQILRIRTTTLSHSGNYACVAENEAGLAKMNFDVVIKAPPRLYNESQDEAVSSRLGQQISLDCFVRAEPPASVVWMRNGQRLRPEADPFLHLTAAGQRLHLLHLRHDDAAKYTCLAANSVGSAQKDFTVQILVPPRFVTNSILPSPTSVLETVESRDVEIECYVFGNPTPSISWSKDGKPLSDDNASLYEFLHGDQVLRISDVRVADGGSYNCLARNPSGEASQTLELVVQMPATIDHQTPDTLSTRLHEGAELWCSVHGVPSPMVTWLKNGHPLMTFGDTNMAVTHGGTRLHLLRTRLQDLGVYTCLATNTAGQDTRDFHLRVQVPASLDRQNYDPSPLAVVNQSLVLSCPVSGTPPLQVTWTFNGSPIARTNHILADGGQKLNITFAQPSDGGSYKCTATNEAGTDEMTFKLGVLVPPPMKRSFSEHPDSEEVQAQSGQSLTLTCPLSEEGPVPSVAWWKDGRPLSLPSHLQMSSDGLALRLVRAQPADRGRYRCIASNVAGDSHYDLHLSILEAPEVDGDHQVARVFENQSLTLECSVRGHPEPQITWLYEGVPLENPKVLVLTSGRKLRLTKVSVNDEGLYTCVATNDVGSDEKNFTLQVLVPPWLSTANLNNTAIQGNDVVLKCPMKGRPRPRVLWYKDLSLLPTTAVTGPGPEELTIRNVQVLDAGYYVCTGINEAGDLSAKLHLRVTVTARVNRLEVASGTLPLLGQPLRLLCDASGIDPPEITWDRGGQIVDTSDGPRLTVSGGGRYLDIQALEEQDEISFGCTVTNEAGKETRRLQLDVFSSPEIEVPNANLKAVHGQSVQIQCPVSGDPRPFVSWSKDGVLLKQSDRMVLDPHTDSLTVVDVDQGDIGVYTCSATNRAGTKAQNFTLEVYVPPIIWNNSATEQVWVVENDPLELLCAANGNPWPDLIWSKNGVPVLTEKDGTALTPGGLKIPRVQLGHEGLYTCEATNIAGTDIKNFEVSVLVPPDVAENRFPVVMASRVGESVWLDCLVTGKPTPSVTWLKNDRPLSYPFGGGGGYRLWDEGQRLQILQPNVKDTALYTCQVSNQAGKRAKLFELTVIEPPEIVSWSPVLEGISGESILLSCEVKGTPKPEVRWMKDDKLFGTSGQVPLTSLTLEDVGRYTCLAANEAGSTNSSLNLFVHVPATIQRIPEQVWGLVRQDVHLPCLASGSPTPIITWHRNVKGLLKDTEHEVLKNGSLLIRSAKLEDSSVYVCMASNKAGSDKSTRILHVQVPAVISESSPEVVQGIQGQDLGLYCWASGVPDPQISWTKVGETEGLTGPRYHRHLDGQLVFHLLQPQDAGLYECLATNAVGKDTRRTQIIVQTPPAIQSDQPRDLEALEGHPLVVSCNAQGFPPPLITWHLNGVPLQLPYLGMHSKQPGDLYIEKAQMAHNGTYLCVATNDVGRQYHEVTVNVLLAPSLKVVPEDQSLPVGARLELLCQAEGRPKPTITWFHNSTKLPAPVIRTDGTSFLVVEMITRNDVGKYTCLAQSKAGEMKAVATVLVKVPPSMKSSAESVVWAPISGEGRLSCPVEEGDPTPEILWLRDRHRISGDAKRTVLKHEGTLLIRDITSEDAGEYRCLAVNEYGTSEATLTLSVESPPQFKLPPRNSTVDLGASATLDCLALAKPVPTVRWTRNAQHLTSGERIILMMNSSLRIVAVEVKDEGLYSCEAANKLGSIHASAELRVRVDGEWSPWSAWGSCKGKCGSGVKSRLRTCNGERHGGKRCPGSGEQSQTCVLNPCPVDGGWSKWSEWSDCSAPCGQEGREGIRKRHRKCENPLPKHGGLDCPGDFTETQHCTKDCPVDGSWSAWSAWGPCSLTCGDGVRSRSRACSDPAPHRGGKDCSGPDRETKPCRDRICPVDGVWGHWGPWAGCSLSCGGGRRERRRACDSPAPQLGGRYCIGTDVQLDFCNGEPCPVHGGWSAWSPWGECSSSCGQGFRKRFRTCSDPAPSDGGRMCAGSFQDMGLCTRTPCPVHGRWSAWGSWSSCSVTCGKGRRKRTRQCSNPTPRFGGRICPGEPVQGLSCFTGPCSDVPVHIVGNLIGEINGQEFGLSKLASNVTERQGKRILSAVIDNIPDTVGPWLESLVPLLSPLYWATALEHQRAFNGYTLTKGVFKREGQVAFLTGETLHLTQVGRGLDKNGHLQVDVVVSGQVPSSFYGDIQGELEPYAEKYIQTGVNSLYAESSRTLRGGGGYLLPEAWNHSVEYDSSLGHMPFPTEVLRVKDVKAKYHPERQTLTFSLSSTIGQGDYDKVCPSGFRHEHPYCKDIDECSARTHQCADECTNTMGGYLCRCPEGFTLGPDGLNCADVDECLLFGCLEGQECENSIGSYTCNIICDEGFKRSPDGMDCLDADECTEGSHGCSQTCVNTVGSFTCQCLTGFQLVGSYACLDIDECRLHSHPPCSQDCTNVPGTYYCSCRDGYSLVNGSRCQDIDECTIGHHNCGTSEVCRNVPGSYECGCPPGMAKAPNGTCVDVDECSSSLNQCHHSQSCQNTEGSYRCLCPQGYKSEAPGRPCRDVDECLAIPSPCGSFPCRNTVGDFECICPPGLARLSDGKSCAGLEYASGRPVEHRVGPFHNALSLSSLSSPVSQPGRILHSSPNRSGPGTSCPPGFIAGLSNCQDVDECLETEGLCQHLCQNTAGSYRCLCPPGYRVGSNGQTCQDVNECLEMGIQCGPDKLCFNTRGKFKCVDTPCPPNYERDPITGYCKLECERSSVACPPNTRYAEFLAFKTVALPSGIQAYQDIVRLSAYDQEGLPMPNTVFTLADAPDYFRIRPERGRGVLYSRQGLQPGSHHQIKVKAVSFRHNQRVVHYTTHFIVFLSVSEWPF